MDRTVGIQTTIVSLLKAIAGQAITSQLLCPMGVCPMLYSGHSFVRQGDGRMTDGGNRTYLLDYIEDLTFELAKMANAVECDRLAFLLDLARTEAAEISGKKPKIGVVGNRSRDGTHLPS
jgi:hypothetical protein